MGLLDFLGGPFKAILDKLVPDANQRLELQQKAMEMAQAGEFKELDAQMQSDHDQAAANAAEAAQPGLHFRDGAGWTCVFGFAVMTLKPLVEWGCILAGHPVTLPPVDLSVSMPMLFGLLGLGGMHVYQQVKQQ